jgi:flavin-dependent dehydrogenase
MKALREPAVFDRVVAACPRHAHWLDGEPITGVLAMAGVLDRYRRLVVDGLPVVTGFLAVGDAWACTNPSAGRGISVGAVHAQLLRAVVRTHLDDPAELARAFDELTEQQVAPFYRSQLATDRARIAEMDALRAGRRPPPPDPARTALLTAAAHDADAYRALLETITCLALPDEVLERPGMAERLAAHAGEPPPVTPGPDRAQLLQLLAG